MAQALNIQMHFIPAGMTDEMQPLDRSIFEPFKAMSRKLFRERNILSQPLKITKSEACSNNLTIFLNSKIFIFTIFCQSLLTFLINAIKMIYH